MKKLKTIIIVLALVAWQQASAVNFNCEGEVQQMYVASNSAVLFEGSWTNNWITLCHLGSDWNGITSDTCKTWFSMALAAYHAKTTVMVRYDNAPSATCATLPAYGNTIASYFMLRP